MGHIPKYSQALPERSISTFQRVVSEISRATDYRFLCRLRDVMTDVLRLDPDDDISAQRRQRIYLSVHDLLTEALRHKERCLRALQLVERGNEVLLRQHALIRGSLRHVLRSLPRWMGLKSDGIDESTRAACRLVFQASEARLDQIRPESDPQVAWNIYVRERKTG